MSKLITILFMLPLLCFGQLKKDKYYHAGVGTGLTISTHLLLPGEDVNPAKGTLIVGTIATFKEFFDVMNGGIFSGPDILATITPAIVIDTGVLIFKKRKKKKKDDPFDKFELTAIE